MEEEILRQLDMFETFGIDVHSLSYANCVNELIKMHSTLLTEKMIRDKSDFRQNLYNVLRHPN